MKQARHGLWMGSNLAALVVLLFAFPWNAAGAGISLPVQARNPDTGELLRSTRTLDPGSTAIVVIDMWDRHWCVTYTARVGALVDRMNVVLDAARALGITVVHAPSDVLRPYQDAPQRRAMLAVEAEPLPVAAPFQPPLPPWHHTGGCECGPERGCTPAGVWTRQHPALRIEPGDLIGDCNAGDELMRLCAARGIRTLLHVGVASNMCVCHRGFGLFNARRHGLDCLFISDLVAAISGNGYDPERSRPDPALTPAAGTARVQEYLERHVAPSILSRDFLRAARPEAADSRPHAVFVVADEEYETARTLATFARENLEPQIRCSFLQASPDQPDDIPGLEAVRDGDLLVLSMRRRFLPVPQMDDLERYVRAGRPLLAIRTAVVPFAEGSGRTRSGKGRVVWPTFDAEVLGCRYDGYSAAARSTGSRIQPLAAAARHPLIHGIEGLDYHSTAWVYRVAPLEPDVTPLVEGRWSADEAAQPVAWTREIHGRVFYTSLGHPDDFAQPAFRTLLQRAAFWALGRDDDAPRDR